jgi:hypothetical protein
VDIRARCKEEPGRLDLALLGGEVQRCEALPIRKVHVLASLKGGLQVIKSPAYGGMMQVSPPGTI